MRNAPACAMQVTRKIMTGYPLTVSAANDGEKLAYDVNFERRGDNASVSNREVVPSTCS